MFNNSYGASRSSKMYGSTHTIIGYPDYYVCNTTKDYELKRGDDTVQHEDGSQVLENHVKYRAGEIVAKNVYDAIVLNDPTEAEYFTLVEDDKPTDTSRYGDDLSWGDIKIDVGENSGMNKLGSIYYGGGGVYGGGQALSDAVQSFSAINTLCRFDAENNPEDSGESVLIGYGGNATILVGDEPAPHYPEVSDVKEHISIGTGHFVETKVTSNRVGTYTPKLDPVSGTPEIDANGDYTFVHQGEGLPKDNVTYYAMETDGGIYGCGRQTYVEGFRAVDIYNYGYAEHTPQYPKLINTFQLASLLNLNDCCLQLQGARDYTGAAVDATIYSIDRIDELRLNSTIADGATLKASDPDTDSDHVGNMLLIKPRVRNYMAFYNNVHYLGGVFTNTDFESGTYHKADGTPLEAKSYRQYKKDCLTSGDAGSIKERNVATAANMIGINNGFVLKIQNVRRTKTAPNENGIWDEALYYAPIKGVCEVKLLTMTLGEGGGYIYARNAHDDATATDLEDGGNFVFPTVVVTSVDGDSKSFIVDDCFNKGAELDKQAHYWFVEGSKYVYNATLTAMTTGKAQDQVYPFRLDDKTNLIQLSGLDPNSNIKIESIIWEPTIDAPDGYESALLYDFDGTAAVDTRDRYKMYLSIDRLTQNEYKPGPDMSVVNRGAYVAQIINKFNQFEEDGSAVYNYVEGATDDVNMGASYNGTFGNYVDGGVDKTNTPLLSIRLEDSDPDNASAAFFRNHLQMPHNIVIKIRATSPANITNEYTINLTLQYLQGPSVSGNLSVLNHALPGEYIYVDAEGVNVEKDESMWVTGVKWYLWNRDGTQWSSEDVSRYAMADNPKILQLPAVFAQDGNRVDYRVEVNGEVNLSVYGNNYDGEGGMPAIEVGNYHRMKDVEPHSLKLSAGARVYIENNDDMSAFVDYINDPANNGGADIQFCLLGNVATTKKMNKQFRGTLHGNGYAVTVGTAGLMAENAGKIFHTGFIGASSSVIDTNSGDIVNSYSYSASGAVLAADGSGNIENSYSDASYAFGKRAYDMNSYYTGTFSAYPDYLSDYFADGSWRYGYTTANGGWRLTEQNGEPNYANQWGNRRSMQLDGKPEDVGDHSGLYFGQRLASVGTDAYPVRVTEANRVYRAAGYYGSKVKDGFWFNKVAEVYNPSITAIDFTDAEMLDLPEDAVTGLTSFAVRSNSDNEHRDRVTKNLLVYTPTDCGTLFNGLRIYPEAHDLIIESNKDLCLPLFDLDGRMVTMLTVKSGVNRYKYITPGIYIVAGTKFKI